MTNFAGLLTRLAQANVEFVIIGGIAVLTHGHVRAMLDLDICYARTPENLERLERALAPIHPRLRGAPEGLPFVFDRQTLRNGLNIERSTNHVRELGGSAEAVQTLPSGKFARCEDDQGTPFTLWQGTPTG